MKRATRLRTHRDHEEMIIGIALWIMAAAGMAMLPWWFPAIMGIY
jgi:hypothetical protein